MKSNQYFLGFAAFALTFSLLLAAPAYGSNKNKAAAPTPPPDDRKMIQSVNVADSSVVIEYMHDKSTHTYKVDGLTQLKVNNIAGNISEVKAGMEVTDYVERDNDDLDGLSVSGSGSTASLDTPKKSKKK